MGQETEEIEDEMSDDTDELSDSEILYQMGEQLRDDGRYDVPVIGWERIGHDSSQVSVEILTPSRDKVEGVVDWPEKPTVDSKFIRICMEALDISDPEDAAIMADELNKDNGEIYTVPADVENGEWSLYPSVDNETLTSRILSLFTDMSAEDFIIIPFMFLVISPFILPFIYIGILKGEETIEDKHPEDMTREGLMERSKIISWFALISHFLVPIYVAILFILFF